MKFRNAMRLGRRLLVCAVLAALTRKGRDVSAPAPDKPPASTVHAPAEAAPSEERARSRIRSPARLLRWQAHW